LGGHQPGYSAKGDLTGHYLTIRADATVQMGSGHIMRCLALAQAWRARGGEVTFLSACENAGLRQRIEQAGCAFVAIPKPHPDPGDLSTTLDFLAKQSQPQWMVLDGYHFTPDYQAMLRGARLLVMDDMAALERYHADIMLNQNSHAPHLSYHTGPDTLLLLGTRYALLREEFSTVSPREPESTARKVLVTLGGSDPDNATLKVIRALRQLADIEAKVVIGPANPHAERLRQAADGSTVELLYNVTRMPELMAWADVAVTASGSTCWELLYMGLPSAVIVLAENQEPIARDLSERGAVINLGWQHDLNDEQIGAALCSLIGDAARRKQMAACGRALVDGRGAERVIWAMQTAEIDLRPAQESDCRMIWEWANDPGTRANSFASDPIPWETHVRWFENQLRDATKMLMIASQGERGAIGQVRFAIDAPEATISVAVDSRWRGQGYGSKLIFRASQRVFQTTPVQLIYAYIKTDNSASRRVFAQAGYVDQDETTVAGHPARIMTLAREL